MRKQSHFIKIIFFIAFTFFIFGIKEKPIVKNGKTNINGPNSNIKSKTGNSFSSTVSPQPSEGLAGFQGQPALGLPGGPSESPRRVSPTPRGGAAGGPLSLSEIRYWCYQIQSLDVGDPVAAIVDSQYDMVVVDPTVTTNEDFNTADMVSRIKASKASDGVHRKLVIAYIDIGQAEEWRWYWDGQTTYEEEGECINAFVSAIQQWAPWVVACDPDGWAGNYPVAYWDPDWKDVVIDGTTLGMSLYFDSMLDEVIQDGFDGIYLDWVEAWEMDAVQSRAQSEGKDPGQEMLAFINEMRAYGEQSNPDFIIIQQNSSELINEVGVSALSDAVDAIAQEGIWWEGDASDDWNDPDGYDIPSTSTNYYISRLRTYQSAGLPVFVCDYAVSNAEEVYTNSSSEGFIGYATRRSLSRLTTTPPDFTTPNLPVIALSRSRLNFGAVVNEGNPGSQSFLVSNSNSQGFALNWTVSCSQSWLSCSPSSGAGNGSVAVSVDASALSAGSYTGSVSVTDSSASNSPQSIAVSLTVYGEGEDEEPFGSFETPQEGASVSSSVPVTGWVLDDVEVSSVTLYRGAVGSLAYIGDALLVEGARPDIESAFPDYPASYKAGWGYMMLTNFLPNQGNGTFTLHAVATDNSGNEVSLGSKTITCDNANAVKPFGAIDTPSAGGTASGSAFRNVGWVLTPMPNSIATDGSTLNVYIDGVSLGHPVYGLYRPDIAALFPGYANSDAAQAYMDIDMAAHSNGLHTIAWSAVDSGGNSDGIGSRYFSVQNTGSIAHSPSDACCFGTFENSKPFPMDLSPMEVVNGYGKNAKPRKISPGKKGLIHIDIAELERVVIRFRPEPLTQKIPPATDAGALNVAYSGFLMVGDKLKPLPTGSTLDAEKGIFYWQPGVGFVGEYRFLFLSGSSKRVIVIDI